MSILTCAPLGAAAATAPILTTSEEPEVIITELQTAAASASEEFIELYNTTDTDIDFADTVNGGKNIWKLQFYSSNSIVSGNPDWTKPAATVSLTGIIPAYGYYVIAASDYLPGGIDSDQTYSPRLSDSGGAIQLMQSATTSLVVYDRLMWKKSVTGQTLPENVNPSPEAGSSLQRLPNEDDGYTDENDELTSFTLSATISPKDIWQPEIIIEPEQPEIPEVPVESEVPSDTDEQVTTETPPVTEVDNAGLLTPLITELLPNPGSPLTDDSDEFIELYNPNDTPYELKGHTLEVGTATLHDFTIIESFTLPPLSHTAFYSRDTHLTLANTAGQARLLNADGTVLSETSAYTAAKENESWALENGVWQWSASTTPGLANIVTSPITKAKAAVAKKTTAKASTKKATAKLASAKKVKGAITKKAKTKKASKPKLSTVAQTAEQSQESPIHSGILVTVVALAVLYAAYEYRSDISNRIYKLRHNRAIRFISRS